MRLGARLGGAVALLGSLMSASLMSGCGSKDSVALSAYILDAEFQLEQVTLGAQLKGSFVLGLELGPEAPEATEVSLQSFTLAPAGGAGDLVPSFSPEPESVFPLRIGVGEKQRVTFNFEENRLLSAELAEELCAGPIELRGSVRDSLSGDGLTSLRSQAFDVQGCP